tara:strand:+ start:31 stop:993 length:963 start_codon:yes stop_codon:yes gene_type:complete
MKKIKLGRTEELVSAISLGTWSYGGSNTAGGISVGWGGQQDADSKSALLKAWSSGINHWDTADVYGNGHSELIIGKMWKMVPRGDIFLATKVGWDKGDKNHWYSPNHMRNNMERSLKNLKTEWVDLMYLHHCNFGKKDEFFDDALEMIKRFQDEGKIRFVGLSDWSSEKIMAFIVRCDPDVVQPHRNIIDDNYESSGLKNYIEKHNLGICFFSPLKHGLLTGKYKKPPAFPKGDHRCQIKEFQNLKILEEMISNKSILEKKFPGHPNPVLHGLVDSLLYDVPTGCVLLGQRNKKQVQAASTLGDALSYEDTEWIKSIYKS